MLPTLITVVEPIHFPASVYFQSRIAADVFTSKPAVKCAGIHS